MTTIVTITTVGWPARITITDRYQTSTSGVLHVETSDVPRYSQRQIAITNTRSLQVEELTSEGWQDAPSSEATPVTSTPETTATPAASSDAAPADEPATVTPTPETPATAAPATEAPTPEVAATAEPAPAAQAPEAPATDDGTTDATATPAGDPPAA